MEILKRNRTELKKDVPERRGWSSNLKRTPWFGETRTVKKRKTEEKKDGGTSG